MTISTEGALIDALKKCSGGETIDDVAIVGQCYLRGLKAFAKPVTIAGGSIEAPGLTSPDDHILRLDGGGGLRFQEMTIKGTASPDHGNLGRNLILLASDVEFASCKIGQSHRGIAFANSSNVRAIANDFHDIRSDGVNLSGVSDALLSRNWYRGFTPIEGDHADAIQGFSTGMTVDLSDIVIEDECIEGDPLSRPQGIFLSDPLRDPAGKMIAGHKGVVIRRVLITNPMWQGVNVAACPGVILESVRLLSQAGGQVVPGGPVVPWICIPEDAQLRDVQAPRFLKGLTPVAITAPAGAQAIGTVAPETIEDALAAWHLAFRSAAPAPVPTPSPQPTPTPAPGPAPTPTPPPSSLDVELFRARLSKARIEVNAAQDANSRALYAIDKALNTLPK